MRSSRTRAVGTWAWLFIHPPWPVGRNTRPRLRQPGRGDSVTLPLVAENFERLASDDVVEPVVHADAELLARLVSELFGLQLNAFQLAKIPGPMCATARAGNIEIEIPGRLP